MRKNHPKLGSIALPCAHQCCPPVGGLARVPEGKKPSGGRTGRLERCTSWGGQEFFELRYLIRDIECTSAHETQKMIVIQYFWITEAYSSARHLESITSLPEPVITSLFHYALGARNRTRDLSL